MIHRLGNTFIQALFPHHCMACGKFFLPGNKKRYGAVSFEDEMAPFLCSDCSGGFQAVASPICNKCGFMFVSREGDDHLCGQCIKRPMKFNVARAWGVYDRTLMDAVHNLKYNGKIQLAKPLGKMLLDTFMKYWQPEDVDMIVPVPLHKKRFRMRGFNQAYLLIKAWQKISRMPDIGHNALIREINTAPQIGLGKEERRKNIKNAFAVKNPEMIKGKRIVLVDDVYTTGATVDACARVLVGGGAVSVDVLTLARTM